MCKIRNSRQIKNGFSQRYYLTENALVYDALKDQLKQPYKDHCFSLKTEDNHYKKIAQRTLYKLVYNKPFCVDHIKDYQNQEWKQICNSNYWISNYGRLKSYSYRYEIYEPAEQFLNKPNGYYRIALMLNKDRKNFYVHRLVAQYFLENPSGDIQDYQVHHIDGNRQNNYYKNLKWVTKQEHRQIHRNEKSKS